MFSRERLEQLRSFPDIGRDELITHFTLTPADVAFVEPGRGRGPADRLGVAVMVATLPWLGFVPDEVGSAPPVAVARLATALDLAPGALRVYGRRAQTRSDHLGQVAKYLGWKQAAADSQEMKELQQFLTDRAMEHDSPTLLFNLAREYLMSAKVIRPGAIALAKMVGAARAAAGELTSNKVAHVLTGQAWCLTLWTNRVVTWTTEYYSKAAIDLRAQGRDVPDEVLAHISPGHSDNINFFGTIHVDVEAELAKLSDGWRPLRPAQLRELGL